MKPRGQLWWCSSGVALSLTLQTNNTFFKMSCVYSEITIFNIHCRPVFRVYGFHSMEFCFYF